MKKRIRSARDGLLSLRISFRHRAPCFVGVAAIILCFVIYQFILAIARQIDAGSRLTTRTRLQQTDGILPIGPCAINLYGLPRAFSVLVLPSLIENVVRPNLKYKCDYFVHYHYRLSEPLGRDGRGGSVDPKEVLQIRSAIMKVSDYLPKVAISKTTEDAFQHVYGAFLDELHTATDENGNLLYMPVNHPSYDYDTVDNVVRMFHGQSAVWEQMESASRTCNASPSTTSIFASCHYSRVAMLRLDVVFATPIDIYKLPDGSTDVLNNEVAVIPGFAQHPVNDRLIYGPYDAVRIWAASRFDRLGKHIQLVKQEHRGDGIHAERFLVFSILPAIVDSGITIMIDPEMCFLRARSDQSIRLDDCGLHRVTEANQRAVESLVQRKCHQNKTDSNLVHLECREGALSRSPTEYTWKS